MLYPAGSSKIGGNIGPLQPAIGSESGGLTIVLSGGHSIEEGSPIGTTIGELSVDGPGDFDFSITSDPNNFFEVAQGDGATFEGAISDNVMLSDGDLTATGAVAAGEKVARAGLGLSTGKWFFEIEIGAVVIDTGVGLATADSASYLGADDDSIGIFGGGGGVYFDGAYVTACDGFTEGDIVGVMLDLDESLVSFRTNGGIWKGDIDISALSRPVCPAVNLGQGASTTANFGATPYAFAVPSGFSNIPSGGDTVELRNRVVLGHDVLLPQVRIEADNGVSAPISRTFTIVVDPLATVINIQAPPYNAPDSGIGSGTADFPAFEAFHNWSSINARFVPQLLIIPAGEYDVGTTLGGLFSSGTGVGPYYSPRELMVHAAGAIINSPIMIGAASCVRTDGYRVDTVLAGASTVHFVTPGEAANFVTDINGDPLRWACMTALDLQSPSLPTNCHYFEYCEILSVDTVANTVTFVAPLTRSYKSTYPLINWYQALSDGPATIYPMDPRFDMKLTIEGEPGNLVQFTQVTQCYFNGRDMTLRYVEFTGDGLASGQCKSLLVEDSILCAGQNEWDKLVTDLTIRRCTGFFLTFQSSSVYNVDIDGLVLESSFAGTPYNLTMANADIAGTLNIGSGYGWSNSIEISDSSFAALEFLRNRLTVASFLSSTGGVLVRPLNNGVLDDPISWAVEGAKLFIYNGADIILGYYGEVTDIRQNGANIEVVTDAAGVIPTYTGTFTATHIGTLGCNSFSLVNCSGCEDALEYSAAPAGTRPGEYHLRTYNGSIRQPTSGLKFGKLVSISVNVTQAYTGVAPTCLLHVAAASGAAYVKPDLSTNNGWDPVINLKIAGVRTFTPGGGLVGGQSGDNFPAFAADNWLLQFAQYFATDISGESAAVRPIVTIEAIFDQGVP